MPGLPRKWEPRFWYGMPNAAFVPFSRFAIKSSDIVLGAGEDLEAVLWSRRRWPEDEAKTDLIMDWAALRPSEEAVTATKMMEREGEECLERGSLESGGPAGLGDLGWTVIDGCRGAGEGEKEEFVYLSHYGKNSKQVAMSCVASSMEELQDRTIKIWDLASGRLKLTLTGHIEQIRGLAVSSKHTYMFSAGDDKQVKCWDLDQNKVIRSSHGLCTSRSES
ncbi:platelet-activating factor acetylhydrolase IB subunit beta-like [Eucalyptus grandis]|uniref:platelet-activating factor acetylhydrolase IB subunit beta-like n=1 Tax=Eucalyptus grandis TaxID=71139 RepID=UPI00192EE287|nr:platelet-activating factor acetylhydrolase IB subunit beta-like [Eucalyptus grandis]